jgi:arsenite methyltransferase
VGIDMTPAQLAKAERLRQLAGLHQVELIDARIERLPLADSSFDAVISNGVINLAPDKLTVFREAARVLRPGGRLAIADVVTQVELPPSITCNAELWAACIGGAGHQPAYQQAIDSSGLTVEILRRNPYQFVSEQAQSASATYGVMSVSILARRNWEGARR